MDLHAVVVVDRQPETIELGSSGPTRMFVLPLDRRCNNGQVLEIRLARRSVWLGHEEARMRAFAIDGFGQVGSIRDLPEPVPVVTIKLSPRCAFAMARS